MLRLEEWISPVLREFRIHPFRLVTLEADFFASNDRSTVLQVGLPANAEQYIHRLGRTARAGASGSGILILAPFETFFLRKREVVALNIGAHPATATTLALGSAEMRVAREDCEVAMRGVEDETKSQFYGAALGFYKVRALFAHVLIHIQY